ncbi:hypothetical protein FisN_1Hu402 [Fistulifera solaris]|uniref:Uncharacterized protein n=1 Tax=Fistulifera solaris TaxID=1519565 RepID=A0A1Z5KGV7_FISSO|nr:hypothetical protein FisN_1Hu402 [Fistulifera solaris]|eukprot:GAX25446.1 hypothetical protein FisN_1Hu402 [Fistulifera solaris]
MDEAMLGHLLHMIVAIWVLLLTISCDKVTRQLPGVVKRDLVWNTDVRNMANDMADWVADAFVYAINEGGMGTRCHWKCIYW